MAFAIPMPMNPTAAPALLEAAMRMASACDAARFAAAIVGSRMTAAFCSSLIMASSSGEATMEFTPKAATSMPRICPQDWESSSFSACASSLVCAGTAEYRTPIAEMRANAGCSAVSSSLLSCESILSRV